MKFLVAVVVSASLVSNEIRVKLIATAYLSLTILYLLFDKIAITLDIGNNITILVISVIKILLFSTVVRCSIKIAFMPVLLKP